MAASDGDALNKSTPGMRLSQPRGAERRLRWGVQSGSGTVPRRSSRSWGGFASRSPRRRSLRLIARDFRVPRPWRRSDFGGGASVAYEFVQFGFRNGEPETFRGARSRDARRDKPSRSPRRSASAPAAPRVWPTLRDPRARNPLSQNAVRTPQNANAPAVGPGRSLLTCRRASFARASWS